MKIIKINTEGNIYNIDVNIKDVFFFKKENKNIENLYNWKYNNNTIELYGSLDSDCNIKNIHKLPQYGISNIIEEKSEEIHLYGNLYILYKNNTGYVDFNDYDYGTFYFNVNELNESDIDSNDESDNDEIDINDDETGDEINNNDDSNTENIILKKYYIEKNENINDNLDYDNNIYI